MIPPLVVDFITFHTLPYPSCPSGHILVQRPGVHWLTMKLGTLLIACALALLAPDSQAQQPAPPATLRSTLLDQLHSTHDHAEWFVPINTAVAGLTPEQAKWTPPKSPNAPPASVNHSVGMLAYHLWFWDSRALAQFKKEKQPQAPANDETFNEFNAASWPKLVHDLDQVMTSLEDLVAHASDADLARWAPTLANISTHNGYHTGQILYVRKLQGVWDPNKGVK